MPDEKQAKSVDSLRHAEYYGMQPVFDDLYARAKEGEYFTDLMSVILSRKNILLAYRNIKANHGSHTAGIDGLVMADIGKQTPEEVVARVRRIVYGGKEGYAPRSVRRVEIPKADGVSTRPLGIPCVWDRLIQQCIKQVMEPICEAKFSENSYGFRPTRSVENAIAAAYRLIQRSNLHYVVEFDVKGFFDNVDHAKLICQLWSLGIRDKKLLYVLKRVLKAPIRMPDGSTIHPEKGTPQGGIISPLLANVVLNELDKWVESQWQDNPVIDKYEQGVNRNGTLYKNNGYRAMRKTKLKEMYIVRYADDFRIFCRTKTQANNVLIAVTQWLKERLRLDVSPEKTKVVNLKRHYSDFLGFKLKVRRKGPKYVVRSRMGDKAVKKAKCKLTEQAKNIAKPRPEYGEAGEVRLYNSMVRGAHNYYHIATDVSLDCSPINRAVMVVLKNRLGRRLARKGRELTKEEAAKYGKSEMLRYVAGSDEPVLPIGYVQTKNPMSHKRKVNCYTAEGRAEIHDNLRVNTKLMLQLMRTPAYGRSAEFMDNRISLFCAQWGRCSVTGREFKTVDEIHCHHITPRAKGGKDNYENLTLVEELVHKPIHATKKETIDESLRTLRLDKTQMSKLNKFRERAGNDPITA